MTSPQKVKRCIDSIIKSGARSFWNPANRHLEPPPDSRNLRIELMETATTVRKEEERPPGGLHRSNQIAAFNRAESHAVVAARVKDCVGRAFYAMGISPTMQQVIYWNLSVTKSVGPDDVVDKPAEFIEGLQCIYGEAGTLVFEYLITREIKREFGITSAFDEEAVKGKGLAELLRFIVANLTHD
jgi:hypothetical protein